MSDNNNQVVDGMCCMNGYWGCDTCFTGGKPIRDLFLKIYKNYSYNFNQTNYKTEEQKRDALKKWEEEIEPLRRKLRVYDFQKEFIDKIIKANREKDLSIESNYKELETEMDKFIRETPAYNPYARDFVLNATNHYC